MRERTAAKELKGCLDALIILLVPVGLMMIVAGQIDVPHLGSLQGLSWIGAGVVLLALAYIVVGFWRTKNVGSARTRADHSVGNDRQSPG